MLIEISPEQADKVLWAINQIDEYDQEWDELYAHIYNQYNHGKRK